MTKTQRLGANGPVFDADGMTPDECAEGRVMDNQTIQIMVAYSKLDHFEKMIFSAGVKALADNLITGEQFGEWATDTVRRYRAGEDLALDDLAPPKARVLIDSNVSAAGSA